MGRAIAPAKPKGFTYTRPVPPPYLRRPGLCFARAEELEAFVVLEYLNRGGIFWDPEHGHLSKATIGFVWASSRHSDKGSMKAGTAQLVKIGEPSKWGEAMRLAFLRQMFGAQLPTFLITLHAPTCATYDDREFFALVDHELSHCAIATDQWGAPRFSDRTGEPIYATRPHDHEGFSGTTERWGAVASGAASLVTAGMKRARFDWVPGRDLDLREACGS